MGSDDGIASNSIFIDVEARTLDERDVLAERAHAGLGAPGPWEQESGARGCCWNRSDQDIGFAGHVLHERPRTSRF